MRNEKLIYNNLIIYYYYFIFIKINLQKRSLIPKEREQFLFGRMSLELKNSFIYSWGPNIPQELLIVVTVTLSCRPWGITFCVGHLAPTHDS